MPLRRLRHRQFIFVLLAAVASSIGTASAQTADEVGICRSPFAVPASRIADCTELINSGKFSGYDLAYLYRCRSDAYVAIGDTERGLKDYKQMISINAREQSA